MATFVEARYGFTWNFAPGDSGWGDDYNFTHRALGTLLNAYLISDTTTAPPASPLDGDAYLVPAGPSGVWSGQTNKVAAYQGGSWQFYPIPHGFRCYIISRGGFYWWNGAAMQSEVSASTTGVTSVAARTGDVTLASTDILDFAAAVDSLLSIGSDGKIGWAALKAAVQQQPIVFVLPGKPTAGQVFNIPMIQALTIPANMAGTRIYAGTPPAANATFTFNRINGGVTSTLGTITKTTTNNMSATLSIQAAISLAVGDVLQLVAPATQDATMADIGITILAAKV